MAGIWLLWWIQWLHSGCLLPSTGTPPELCPLFRLQHCSFQFLSNLWVSNGWHLITLMEQLTFSSARQFREFCSAIMPVMGRFIRQALWSVVLLLWRGEPDTFYIVKLRFTFSIATNLSDKEDDRLSGKGHKCQEDCNFAKGKQKRL